MKISRFLIAGLLSASALVGTTACRSSTSGASGSRHELYESVEELVAASAFVVTGTVTGQIETGDTTNSTFSVTGSYAPAGLKTPDVPLDDTIIVRQMGTSGDALPYPLMTPGQDYLLFLVPTELPGDAGDDYYVVGGSAGIYEVDGEAFVHVPSDEGDMLPEKLTPDDLT
ncbi:hypothetical protein [Microbacterium gorillae]|uniref:hypothetical protein n=1 Tax=Microbacterium gorillae TaxID=1231063 RepID=UPI003D97CB26